MMTVKFLGQGQSPVRLLGASDTSRNLIIAAVGLVAGAALWFTVGRQIVDTGLSGSRRRRRRRRRR